MKKPLVFIAGIFVGAALLVSARTLIVNDAPPTERVSADPAVLKAAKDAADREKALQSELDQREAYVEKAENKLGLATPAQAAADEAKAANKSKMMSAIVSSVMKSQMDMKLAALKSRLNLSPDQEKAVTDLMAKQEQLVESLAGKMADGSMSRDDMKKEMQDQKDQNGDALNLDKQLQNILTPDQQTQYQAMQADDKKNAIETQANMEFTNVQGSLQLSEDQKDPVFNALLKLNQNPPKGDITAQAEAKKAALQPLLTPAQFETYSKSVDSQTEMIKSFMPANADGSGDAPAQ